MFTAENCLNRMYEAPYRMLDPGNGNTIYPRKQFSQCPVVTAAAETRTLEQPYKAGMIHTVNLDTDGGDLTLTVTGGYNNAGATTLVLDTAGDFVLFMSIKVGTSYVWRVVATEGGAAAPSPSSSPSASVSSSPSASASSSPSSSPSASASSSPSSSPSAT